MGENLGLIHNGPGRVPGEEEDKSSVWCRQRIQYTFALDFEIQKGSEVLGVLETKVCGGAVACSQVEQHC